MRCQSIPEIAGSSEAVAEPFPSSWAFDVRLLHRLLMGNENAGGLTPELFLEIPLDSWMDVKGSKVHLGGAIAALSDVIRVGIAQRRSRRRPEATDSNALVDRGIAGHGLRHSRDC